MSGVEALAVVASAAAPKVLASVAGPAAAAVGRRVLFRRRVARRASKAVDFWLPGRPYRKWLKSLTRVEFAKPAEEVSSALAISLDEALSEKSAEWSEMPDHLSRALRLVEETFPAIAAELKDRDYRQLTEQWAAERSSRARERLFQEAGPDAALSSADLSLALLRRSDARRDVRLLAFDLGDADLTPYFERIQVPEVPVGELRVLIGDIGAGKSEMAEAWHRRSVLALSSDVDAPVPAWLRARELGNRPLEQAVDEQAGTAWRRGRGADLVVDGLDEADAATAQAVFDGARVLVRSFHNVRVLLTARPGAVSPGSDEHLPAPLLSDDEAKALVLLSGARVHSTLNWTSSMRATVRRPFFALAAGVMLTREEAPRGEADLIRALVENALQKGSERAAVTSAEIYPVLKRLAVALTDTKSDVHLSFSERQIALSSRLVALSRDGGLTFSLPIFQHWFAAEAIRQREVSPQTVVSDAASFNQWRWAAAVAVLSEQNIAALDDLISIWVTGNPGAAGWILKESFGGSKSWRQPDDEPLDSATSGPRLLRALRTWAEALGPWSACVLPPQIVSGTFELGVAINGHRITVGLSLRTVTEDTVAELPEGLNPFQADPMTGWQVWLTGSASEGAAWPWLIVRDLIAEPALKSLETEPYLGGHGGVWEEDRRYAMAVKITGHGSLFRQPIPADDIRRSAEELLNLIDLDGYGLLNGDRFGAVELDAMVRWLDDTGAAELLCPVPAPDALSRRSRIWGMFSEEGLKRFEVEVYARACIAYEEAMANTFSTLGWSMQTSALQPMGVLLGLYYIDGPGGRSPRVTVIRVPVPLMPELAAVGPDVVWSATGRAVIDREPDDDQNGSWQRHYPTLQRIQDWLAQSDSEAPNSVSWSSTRADDMMKTRPSVAIAARWLSDDLKSLGLVKGTFPQVK
jgi:hypothetical protein